MRGSAVVLTGSIHALRRPWVAEAAQAWRWRCANHGSIWDSRLGAALWLCWVIRGSIRCPV